MKNKILKISIIALLALFIVYICISLNNIENFSDYDEIIGNWQYVSQEDGGVVILGFDCVDDVEIYLFGEEKVLDYETENNKLKLSKDDIEEEFKYSIEEDKLYIWPNDDEKIISSDNKIFNSEPIEFTRIK